MNILISRCLLGVNCRYDGNNNYIKEIFENFDGINFIDICPEVDAGMTCPREPAEISNDRVVNINGLDVSDYFKKGAEICLKIAKENDVKIAILKSKSPSCGSNQIYDGSFSKKIIDGDGITAKLLKENNIMVFTENELDQLKNLLKNKRLE